MRGGPAAWNTLARRLREGKPFHSAADSPGMPEQLRWGQEKEEQGVDQFWLRHPEYHIGNPGFSAYGDDPDHPMYSLAGVSVDRILRIRGVDEFPTPSGILELKCPYDPNVHLGYSLGGKVPDEHICQLRWGMHVWEAKFGIFASFNARDDDPDTNYVEFHVKHDEAFEAKMLEKLDIFLTGYQSGTEFTTEMLTPKTASNLRSMF